MGLVDTQNPSTASGSRKGIIIALQVIFVSFALIFYCLRLYTRSFILRYTGRDDLFMGIAMFVSIALATNACVSTRYGFGVHLGLVPKEDFGSILFCIWLSELLFTISTSLVKISILLFYLRLAVTRTYRQVIYGSIAFISAWAVAFSALVMFQCHPVSDYWNPTATTCYHPEIPLFIHGLTNTITDIYIYVLPMRMVWKTQLPRRQRIGLLFVFGAGFLTCIAGVLRLYFSITTQVSNDSTWEGISLWTWESIEVNLGIVCSSAPCLKALITRYFPNLMSTTHNESTMSPAATTHYQLRVQRNPGSQNDYILESIGRIERNDIPDKGPRESNESQEGLTKVHQHTLVAKVDVNQLA